MGPSTDAVKPPRDTRQARSLTLLILLVAYAASGFAAVAFHWEQLATDVVQLMLMVVASLVWFELDAHERRKPLRNWERIGIVLFALLFVPIRLFRTRGMRALLSLLLLFLYVVLFE